MRKLKYALFINDVLIEKFYTIHEIDSFLDNYIGYIGKIEVKKLYGTNL